MLGDPESDPPIRPFEPSESRQDVDCVGDGLRPGGAACGPPVTTPKPPAGTPSWWHPGSPASTSAYGLSPSWNSSPASSAIPTSSSAWAGVRPLIVVASLGNVGSPDPPRRPRASAAPGRADEFGLGSLLDPGLEPPTGNSDGLSDMDRRQAAVARHLVCRLSLETERPS